MSYQIAGIEVHKKVLMVVVMDASTPDEKPERRRFGNRESGRVGTVRVLEKRIADRNTDCGTESRRLGCAADGVCI